jgi:hypothetical protein
VSKYAKLSLWSDQQRESLVDIARGAFIGKECHDATSLAWVLRDLTESGALVWDNKPTRRQTYRAIAGDVLSYMERQGLIVCESSGWYRRRPLPAPAGRPRSVA